ncbi:MAG: hypothetical protein ACREE7_11065, partial [Dongiaceae bacterium]
MIAAEDVQELLAFEPADATVVSLYLNTDTAQQSSETIKMQARALLRALAGPPDDAAALEQYLDLAYGWDKPGLALFSCARHGFLRAYPAALAFRNRARVGRRPHVKPLMHLLDHYANYGVIVVDRIGAQFYAYHLGELLETGGFMGEEVRKLKRGGGSAATGQRGGGQRAGDAEIGARARSRGRQQRHALFE